MKLVHLTCATPVPKQEVQEKIKKAVEKGGVYRDKHGRSAEEYEDLGVPLPKDFYDNKENDIEIDEFGMVDLKEEDLDFEAASLTIPLENIDSWVENPNFGSRVYTKSGIYYDVFESVEEIDGYVDYLNLNFFEKLYLYIKIKLKLNN